ncbi:hypothetical protein CK203_102989 [Vitis vinifera]|uniref:GAG-pre-integrase domain-containing protein n=1 Tax=Vitis vinifera TaxID=29760 RepID=A0A438CJ17_VITVI|nr:hypothetical protein CK203_102989 [Vitis vinifera]
MAMMTSKMNYIRTTMDHRQAHTRLGHRLSPKGALVVPYENDGCSPTAINHLKTSPNIDKSTFKCTHCNKTNPTSLDIPQFQSNDSCRDQRNKDSKKTLTATVAEIKTKANVAKKASALVSPLRPSSQKIVSKPMLFHSLDYNLLSVSQIIAALSCIVIFWPEFCVIKDIQTRQTIGCGIKREKLYYLDLQSKDSNKLQQALMVDGSEEEKKKVEIWLWHRRLGHASFGYLKKLFPSLFAKSDISGFVVVIFVNWLKAIVLRFR